MCHESPIVPVDPGQVVQVMAEALTTGEVVEIAGQAGIQRVAADMDDACPGQ
jgi:hypothetical protein